MDENYTPQMPMVTPTPAPEPGPQPVIPTAPTPAAQDNGTIAGDLISEPKPEKKSSISKKTGIIIGIVILVLVGIGTVFLVLGMVSSGKTGEFEKIANSLTKKIEESNDNKVIYLYDDLKALDDDFGKSPYGNDIKKSAYIYYLKDKPTVCMADGEHMLITEDDKLTVKESKDDCDFKLSEEIATKYLIEHYNKEGYKVNSDKTRKVNSYYEIPTDKGNIYARAELSDGKVIITDDHEIVGELKNVDDEIKAISFYASSVLGMPIGSGNSIVELAKRETSDGVEYIMIQSSDAYGTALKLIEDISKYLVGRKCPNTLMAIRALVWDDSGLRNSYLIRSMIIDGEITIDTLENNETNETK